MMASDAPPLSALEAREQLNKALEKAWSRGSAESSPLALVVVGFDKPETAVGIGILERALRVHCARTHDVFLRRTHDEYVAVLPDTPPAGARHVGEQIVDAMRAEDTDHTHRVSVGVAVSVPDEQQTPATLLRRAETALQAARPREHPPPLRRRPPWPSCASCCPGRKKIRTSNGGQTEKVLLGPFCRKPADRFRPAGCFGVAEKSAQFPCGLKPW